MPFRKLLGLILVSALPLSATAAGSPIPPFALGELQAGLDFCMRVDDRDEDKFERMGRLLMAGLSEDAFEALRKSADFQQGYAEFKAIAAGYARDAALTMCRAAAQG